MTLGWIALVLSGLAAAPSFGAQAPLYGERARPLRPVTPLVPFTPQLPAPDTFFVLQSELSPGVVIHVPGNSLTLFANLAAWGLGGPQHCAIPRRTGARILRVGDRVAGDEQSEAWLLAWFAGAPGWSEWDAPMLVVLQTRPRQISLDANGLHLAFSARCGDVVLMPLYGYYKPPQRGREFLGRQGLPDRGIRTWEWTQGLPEAVRRRCAYCAQVLRAYPVYARESFALEGDSLLLRTEFRWHTITDSWGTRARRLAPLPPALALAWWTGKHRKAAHPFPMQVSSPISDPDVFTPFGPWLGVENTDAYVVRFPLLQYVHETEAPRPPTGEMTTAERSALEWLRGRLAEKFRTTDWEQVWDHGGPQNYCWQVMGDRWYAKALPYLPEDVRNRVAQSLRGYLRQFVLREAHYTPFRNTFLLVGPGIGTWGGYDDAGKFSSNLLETLWCYGHHTGDWETIRDAWSLVSRLFITPLECDWKSFGRMAIAELGDEAAPPLSMARMAYRVGDYDAYAYASYVFVRELVHHYIKQAGASYFRERQPWHSMEPMPEEVYLTNLWGDVAGWQIDGPTYPEVTGERQYNNRWVRFSSEDVARFYRTVLSTEVRAEMDLLTERARVGRTPYRILEDTAHIAPSIVRLRSLLLNERPEDLARLAPPDRWQLGRSADGTAFCLSFLRTHAPAETHRLIPPARRTRFVLGIERAVVSAPSLDLAVETTVGGKGRSTAAFPVLRWWGWRPPQRAEGLPGGEWWGFGQVVVPGAVPEQVHTRRVSWNAAVTAYTVRPQPAGLASER